MGNIMSSSFAPECTELKQTYDDCFNKWYSEEFLKGRGKHETNPCLKQWTLYSQCVAAHLTQDKDLQGALDQARGEAPFEAGGELISNDEVKNK
ncbi:Mitochondrial distribution and morphology protein 35 [Monosporozyma unispora]|nr:Mitochondrial distribution and morphology protein 35 [Kazachstania unispora]